MKSSKAVPKKTTAKKTPVKKASTEKSSKRLSMQERMKKFDGDIPVSYTHLTLPTSDLV